MTYNTVMTFMLTMLDYFADFLVSFQGLLAVLATFAIFALIFKLIRWWIGCMI